MVILISLPDLFVLIFKLFSDTFANKDSTLKSLTLLFDG